MPVITVGGPPGSGTSTLCRLLEGKLGMRYVYAGGMFRKMAMDKGMSLIEFSRLCQYDPGTDMDLDRRMLSEARGGNVILEGRMIGPLCKTEGIDAIKVYMKADTEVRAARVMERDGGDLAAQMELMLRREAIERDRYQRYYGIDPTESLWYDLVIDSTSISPEAELTIVLGYLKEGR